VSRRELTAGEVEALLAGARAADELNARLRSAFDPDLLACRPVEIGAGGLAVDKPGVLRGFSVWETSGAARAEMVLRDGFSDTGQIVAVLSLAPGESQRDWFGDGIAVSTGLYVDLVAGDVAGAVWVRTRQ